MPFSVKTPNLENYQKSWCQALGIFRTTTSGECAGMLWLTCGARTYGVHACHTATLLVGAGHLLKQLSASCYGAADQRTD